MIVRGARRSEYVGQARLNHSRHISYSMVWNAGGTLLVRFGKDSNEPYFYARLSASWRKSDDS